MIWLNLLKAVLVLANTVAGLIRDQKLMDAGEARATAKSLATLQTRLGIGKQVAAEVAAMTDDELDVDLRGD